MYYKKADKLRWQYDVPYKYIFVLNGDKVFVKNENRTDEFNTSSNKLFREISELMVGSVSGAMLTTTNALLQPSGLMLKWLKLPLSPKQELKQLMSSIVLPLPRATGWSSLL